MNRLASLVLALALAGCIKQSYQGDIEVKRGDSVEEKIRIAQSVATAARVRRLAAQLKERFPAMTPKQLDGLSLAWGQTTSQSLTGSGSSTTVHVRVRIRYEGSLDPKPVIEAAITILEPEVNPLGRPAEAQPK
jgi:hypothetical protein